LSRGRLGIREECITERERCPKDPVGFIQDCVRRRVIYWTYHVNMRLDRRHISRDEILAAVSSYQLVESYPEDKYLPSYLVLAAESFHILFATDIGDDNVRVVTAYRPDPLEWYPDLMRRRSR